MGAIGLIAGWIFREKLERRDEKPHAAIEVERPIDLGNHELFSTLEPSLLIRNSGRRPLLIHGITTSCGCLGVFTRDGLRDRIQVQSLAVPPRKTELLCVQFAVTGDPAVPQVQMVRFSTNDPYNPEVCVLLSVVPFARYLAAPAQIALGTVPVGDQIKRFIDIIAHERNLPPVNRVVCSDDSVRVDFQSLDRSQAVVAQTENSELMGRVRILFRAPAAPADISGIISVHCEGRQEAAIVIPITARVRNLVELVPRQLVLPRVSDKGEVYAVSCLCRATPRKVLNVSVAEAPPGLAIQINEVPDNPSLRLVQIDATGIRDRVPPAGMLARVVLAVRVAGELINMPLTLEIQPTALH
jgi:hypothetical protein